MKKILPAILFLSSFMVAQAQEPDGESILRTSGKIYVVVGIIAIIFILIVIYLIRLDRKITKLENKK